MMRSAVKMGPCGGGGGQHKDMGISSIVEKVVVYYGDTVDAVELHYIDGGGRRTTELWGHYDPYKDPQPRREEISLDHDEHITSVEGECGDFDRNFVVRSLKIITTSKPQGYGPFGQTYDGTVPFVLPAPDGYSIVGFHARSGRYLDAIGTYIKKVAPADQIQERCSNYSAKALGFAFTTFIAYVGAVSSSSRNLFKVDRMKAAPSFTENVFVVAMAAYIITIIINFASWMKKVPKELCTALVCLSSFLLILASYLLLVMFNKRYAFYAIVPVLALPIEAFLLPNRARNIEAPLLPIRDPNSHAQERLHQSRNRDEELDRIFKLSADIVNAGGLVTLVLGHYIVWPNHHVSAVGFLFFLTVVLGLYLMMITTVRTAALTRYARYLAYLQMAFLVGTIIAILIYI